MTEVIAEVLESDKKASLLATYSQEILETAIDDPMQLHNLKMIAIIGKLAPEKLRQNMKPIVGMITFVSQKRSCTLVTSLIGILASAFKGCEDLDWLSNQSFKTITEFSLEVVNSYPLINMKEGTQLLNILSEQRQEVKLVIQPLGRNLLYLRSQVDRDPSSFHIGVLSRTILISCYILQECSHLDSIEKVLKLDLKQQLIECVQKLISGEVDPMILDIALEGLSCIWLRFPNKILEHEQVLSEVISKINSGEKVQIQTKVMIL